LGGHQLRLLYRKDILDAAGLSVPTTWEELSRTIDKLKDAETAKGLKPILVPTADSMASQVFMARVASSIRDQGKLTSFFQRKTMEPTIASPPFVAALEDLKLYFESGGGEFSVAEVFAKFAAGESVFAIGWPVASDSIDFDALESDSANWGVMRLPGSQQFFDLKESRWQKRGRNDESQVDLLGIKATNISIADRTSHAKDAAEFVIWLTEKRNSQKLLHRGFWDQFADSVEETHQSKIFLMFPQLPSKRQYLKRLDDSIVGYLKSEDASALKTLENVAVSWEALTEKLGRKLQIGELRSGNGI